jgi:hypothetical protein
MVEEEDEDEAITTEVDQVLAKSGAELYRELVRLHSLAEVDDYYENGKWNDTVMRIDIPLLRAHRQEAGAPTLPDLESIPQPTLPGSKVLFSLPGQGMSSVLSGMFAAKQSSKPAPSVLAAAMPRIDVAAALKQAADSRSAAAGNMTPVSELRLSAIFVAKWNLDATRTKLMLAKMSPSRRHYVIQNFKTAASGSPASTTALEEYIKACEKTGNWDNGVGASAIVAPGGVRPTVRPMAAIRAASAGLARPVGLRPSSVNPLVAAAKRPLSAVTRVATLPAAQRPRLAMGVARAITPRPPLTRPPSSALRPASSRPALAMGVARAITPRPPSTRPPSSTWSSASSRPALLVPPHRVAPAGRGGARPPATRPSTLLGAAKQAVANRARPPAYVPVGKGSQPLASARPTKPLNAGWGSGAEAQARPVLARARPVYALRPPGSAQPRPGGSSIRNLLDRF